MLLHNCNFTTVMNHNVNILGGQFAKGATTLWLRTAALNRLLKTEEVNKSKPKEVPEIDRLPKAI